MPRPERRIKPSWMGVALPSYFTVAVMVTGSPSRTRSGEADRDTVRAACNGAPLPTAQALAPLSFTARTRTRWVWPGFRYPMPALGSLWL